MGIFDEPPVEEYREFDGDVWALDTWSKDKSKVLEKKRQRESGMFSKNTKILEEDGYYLLYVE